MSETEAEEAKEGEDQSMEEILQSIRRIITEDEQEGDEVSDDATDEAVEAVEEVSEVADEPVELDVPEEIAVAEPDDADSDILELTEIMEEVVEPEGLIAEVEPAPEPEVELEVVAEPEVSEPEPEPEPEPEVKDITPEDIEQSVEAENSADDVLSDIDAVLGEPEKAPPASEESLISEDTAAAASAILKTIKKPELVESESSFPTLRTGVTVEDLMIEAMRPMLKEWLDEHLPSVVEHVVQKEVKKLVE